MTIITSKKKALYLAADHLQIKLGQFGSLRAGARQNFHNRVFIMVHIIW